MEPSIDRTGDRTGERTGGENGPVTPPWTELDSPGAGKLGVRPPSEEVRASLAAIQAARAAARSRLQRDSRRVRVVTMAFLAAVAAGSFALAGHFQSARRQAQARAAMARAAAEASLSASAIAPSSPAAAAVPAPPAAVALGAGLAESPPALAGESAALDPEVVAARERALASCSDAYDRHRWRTAAEACGAAAEAQPHDAALAMKVAQAQHARNHYAEAGIWARRAIGLEDSDPEAFIILAHAERRAKNPIAARNAYRRYLVLAPRGWHAAEARAAVHLSRTETSP